MCTIYMYTVYMYKHLYMYTQGTSLHVYLVQKFAYILDAEVYMYT